MTITINLKGRLGNQLFQYATLKNLSIKKGYNFYINTNLEWHGQLPLLNYFNISKSHPLTKIKYQYCQPNGSNFFDRNIYNINDNTILDGHFENIEYFKENEETIKNELTIKDENINNFTDNFINEITYGGASKLVGIHFRRGDLIQQLDNIEEFNNFCKKYLYESLETIMKSENNITLLIFTGGIRKQGGDLNWINYSQYDDLSWVKDVILEINSQMKQTNNETIKQHISPGTIENNELIDYCLLTKCDYIITPYQSTFSFMAYYANKKNAKLFSPTNLYGL